MELVSGTFNRVLGREPDVLEGLQFICSTVCTRFVVGVSAWSPLAFLFAGDTDGGREGESE